MYYGVRGPALNPLISYMQDRQQIVHWNEQISPSLIVRHIVPQGSILCSTFFIYVNDLAHHFECQAACDQQNKSVISSKPKLKEKAQSILFSLTSQGRYIKFLGVKIQSNLKQNMHINEVANKIADALDSICRIRAITTQAVVKIMYYYYFHVVAMYAIMIQGTNPEALRRIFFLKKAI